jgi:predicted nucleotidyltransferase
MRKPLLDALFPRVRHGLLAATFLHPDRWWYSSDLARHLGRPPSSLQRELSNLTEVGLLRRRRDGGRVYYQANSDSPIRRELQSALQKTVGLYHVLRSALEPYQQKIRVAFVFGSFARGEERPESDIDLFVVGIVSLSDLVPVLRRAEETLGRAVQVVLYDPDEFTHKGLRDHFVGAVLSREREFLIGGEDELEALARGAPRRAAHHKRGGNQGPSRRGRSKPA